MGCCCCKKTQVEELRQPIFEEAHTLSHIIVEPVNRIESVRSTTTNSLNNLPYMIYKKKWKKKRLGKNNKLFFKRIDFHKK